MRFSLNFIKEFLDVKLSAQELANVVTMAGMEVEFLEQVDKDWVFDIEVTTNRYDWLSMLGIAREVAACTHSLMQVKYPKIKKTPCSKERKVVIENLGDCLFYTGRVLRGSKIKESPAWLKQRVENCSLSLINNVVDITNYAMLKWGNPLHVFDEDKIKGNIYVRRAKKGEKFIGIDDKERELTPENLVIADQEKIIALAGVMGAKNTEVDENTKNLFLEAAIFSPLVVRQSRRIVGLNTESSYRFERRVHADCLEYASAQAQQLIEELAQAKFMGYLQAGKKPQEKRKSICVELQKLNQYLGTDISKKIIGQILKNLGCALSSKGKEDKIVVAPPRFRFDLETSVDIYEEVARIHGFGQIKPKIPFLLRSTENKIKCDLQGLLFAFKNQLRKTVFSLGLHEIVTYSIESSEHLEKLGEKDFIYLANPLRVGENVMRTTLLSGMLKAICYNLNRIQKGIRFFEIADVYSIKDKKLVEKPYLSIGVEGDEEQFFYLKAVLENILKSLNLSSFEYKEAKLDIYANVLKVYIDGKEIGLFGKVSRSAAKNFDIKSNVFFAQIDVFLLSQLKKDKVYCPYSAYPVIERDISMLFSKEQVFSEIEKVIKDIAKDYLYNFAVVDKYKGKDIPQGFFAITIRVSYQSSEKTLSAQEVDVIHNQIRENLGVFPKIELR